ncbi:MAG: alpha/beta hydrolase [Anaerolineae bacterium]
MTDLLARLKTEGNPLIDEGGVLFVWSGDSAPYLHLETELFEAVTMEQHAPDLWIYRLRLPDDAYIEYNFATTANDPDTIVQDPYNPHHVDTGVGHHNHYVTMPACIHTPYRIERQGISAGTVTYHRLSDPRFWQAPRDLWLYQPPTDQAVPLLVVLDGKDYYERGAITTIVDNLIADGLITPIALALIDNAQTYRMIEYNQNESIPMFLDGLILPFARQHLKLSDPQGEQTGTYGILGASMGGLMALYIGLRMPDIFGKVIAQAGAFFMYENDRPALIHLLVDSLPPPTLQIWLDCGTYDFLYDDNRDMLKRLTERGYQRRYTEHHGGHNYTCWRNLLPDALIYQFGV